MPYRPYTHAYPTSPQPTAKPSFEFFSLAISALTNPPMPAPLSIIKQIMPHTRNPAGFLRERKIRKKETRVGLLEMVRAFGSKTLTHPQPHPNQQQNLYLQHPHLHPQCLLPPQSPATQQPSPTSVQTRTVKSTQPAKPLTKQPSFSPS